MTRRELDAKVNMAVWYGLVLSMIKTCPHVRLTHPLSHPEQLYEDGEYAAWRRGERDCESCLVWQLGFDYQCEKRRRDGK